MPVLYIDPLLKDVTIIDNYDMIMKTDKIYKKKREISMDKTLFYC